MNEILHANIFFIIASVAFVLMSIIGMVILWQVMKLVQALRKIVDRVEAGSERMAADAANIRGFVADGGMFSKMFGVIMSAVAAQSRRYAPDDDDDEGEDSRV